MSLMSMNNRPYGQPNDAGVQMQDISSQRKLAEQLRQQGAQELQGQMVSGRYVAPSWTQQLARVLQSGLGGYYERDAQDKEQAYNKNKTQKYADILAAMKPQQIAGAPVTNTTLPAYEPSQQDQFGSPLPNVQRIPVTTTTTPMTQETPQQVVDRQRPLLDSYVQTYGATPEAQLLMSDFNHQRDRGEHLADTTEARTYADNREEKLYNRDRTDKLSDTEAAHKYDDIVRKDTQGFQISQQDRQFAQAYKLQAQSQNFQAGQTTRQQNFQAKETALNRAATTNNEILKLNAEKSKTKPLTEVQGKANLYGTRANDAHNILNSLEGKYSPMGINAQDTASNTPLIGGVLGAATNAAMSPDSQKAQQAQRNFVTAILRQESGAAISPSEFDVAKKQYFPQTGDSKEVIEQKRKNREEAIQGFATMSSGAFTPKFESPQQQSGKIRKSVYDDADAILGGQ